MKRTVKKYWSWLGENKNQVEALSTVLQVLTIVVGVAVGINEFVIKDRQNDRNRRKTTLELIHTNREFQHSEALTLVGFQGIEVEPATGEITAKGWDSINERFEKLRPLAEDFYARLELGLDYEEFDEKMCIEYFGGRALRVAPMYHKLSRSPNSGTGPLAIDPFFHFAARVATALPKTPFNDYSGIDWYMAYVKRFPDSKFARLESK